MRGSFDVSATSRADAGYLWSLLLDARSWPVWGTVDELVLDRSSGIAANGRDQVAAVRAFRTGSVTTAERIVALDPKRRFEYEDASNPVMHDYHATIQLDDAPAGGTEVRWSGTYATYPVLGLLLQPYLRRTMRRMVQGLAQAGDDHQIVPGSS